MVNKGEAGLGRPPLVRRVHKTKVHVSLLREKCTRCGVCVKVCPSGSWVLREETVEWRGMERCLECGCCYHACPADAIVWRYPEGGEGVIYRF